MAYDVDLVERLRELLAFEKGLSEKQMFGGLAFLLHGNMSVSASGRGGLLVRIDPATTGAMLARPHVSLMEMAGRSMDGWIRVAPEGLRTKRELAAWVQRGVSFARTLPPKQAAGPKQKLSLPPPQTRSLPPKQEAGPKQTRSLPPKQEAGPKQKRSLPPKQPAGAKQAAASTRSRARG